MIPNTVAEHWAKQYIITHRPWVNGAQGPDSFDCWGLVRYVYKHHFNIILPTFDIDANCLKAVALAIADGQQHWQQVESPKDGDVVLLAHAKYPSHIGIWLDVDRGGVLHCVRKAGVVFSDLIKLRLSGWGHIEYYRHKDMP